MLEDPGTVVSVLSVVVSMELAQFGYLWKMNTRTVRNENRTKDNAERLDRLGRRKGERPTPTEEMAD